MQIAIAQENEYNRLQLTKAQIEQAKNRAIDRAAHKRERAPARDPQRVPVLDAARHADSGAGGGVAGVLPAALARVAHRAAES